MTENKFNSKYFPSYIGPLEVPKGALYTVKDGNYHIKTKDGWAMIENKTNKKD